MRSGLRELRKLHPDLMDGLHSDEDLSSPSYGDTNAFSHRLPHELSGGQVQRVSIAPARHLWAEAAHRRMQLTSALDVATQTHNFELLLSLREEIGITLLLMT